MQLITFNLNAGDNPKIIPMNVNNIAPYQVTIQVVPSGGATWSVDASIDNPQSQLPMTFFPISAQFTSQTIQQQDVFEEPVRAYRFTVTGTGSVKVNIQQQGIR